MRVGKLGLGMERSTAVLLIDGWLAGDRQALPSALLVGFDSDKYSTASHQSLQRPLPSRWCPGTGFILVACRLTSLSISIVFLLWSDAATSSPPVADSEALVSNPVDKTRESGKSRLTLLLENAAAALLHAPLRSRSCASLPQSK